MFFWWGGDPHTSMYTKLKLTVRPQKLAFPKRTENSPNHICFGAMLVLGSVHLGFFIFRVFFFFFGQLFFVDPRMVRLVDCGGSPKLGRKNSEDGSVVLTPYIWLCIFTNACMAVCQFLMFFFCGRVNAQWSCVGPKSVWRTPSLVISPGSFTTAAWPCRGQVICMNTS